MSNIWTDPALRAAMDKLAVAELIQTERAARDQGQWDRMAACYAPQSTVAISWITCTGPEFVEASQHAFASGVRHIHQLSPTIVTLHEERALAETGCVILLPATIGGVAATVTCQARLHARCRRWGETWKIAGLTAAYFHDAIAPRSAGDRLDLDRDRLAAYREPYRHMAYALAESGKTAREDLAGPDRPDLMTALFEAEAAWLAGRD